MARRFIKSNFNAARKLSQIINLDFLKTETGERRFLISLFLADFGFKLFRLWDPAKTYFDETPFYIKAARGFLSGNYEINLEHPPLAKLLMALSIKLFGDDFLGWRFFSVFLGSVGVLATYFIAKRLTGSKKIAAVSSIFLSFELGWFISSRVATIEIFVASFLLFGTLFILRLFQDGKLWNILPAGIFFGAALASKWAAVLLIGWVYLFLLIFWKRKILQKGATLALITILAGIVYLFSYSLYLTKHPVLDLIKLHSWMVYYHTKYVPDVEKQVLELHKDYQFYPFPAWTWFFDANFPYYGETFGRVATKAILFFYNPVVLWGGLVGFVSLTLQQFKKIKSEAIFILGVFLSQYLPWFLSPRYSLNYYLLTALPFFAIAFAIWLAKIRTRYPNLVYVLSAAVILTFLLYYPLVSALKVPYFYSRIVLGIVEFRGNTGN